MSSRGAGWARVTVIGLSCAAALFLTVLLGYQLALARVPQHRAALERLLRSQTGLDVRFAELEVRWGWYGPEAVFRGVELGEPGRPEVLLRAPELTVGFDAWRTMRSGHLEAGRIAVSAPDIDLRPLQPRASERAAPPRSAGDRDSDEGVKLLRRWRDGRIEIEGGTLRLPGPAGPDDSLQLQIRRASVRRSGQEWNLFALVFLPERLGRTARIAMRLDGAPDFPDGLSGSVRFQGQRLSFAGWRDLAQGMPWLARLAPVSGGGDVAVNLDFTRGRIDRADGSVLAGGVVLGPLSATERTLDLDRVRGHWRLARHGLRWQVQVTGLELGPPPEEQTVLSGGGAELSLETGTAETAQGAAAGRWLHGKLQDAALRPVTQVAQWLAPHLDLGGVELGGTARELVFDWDGRRPEGLKLRTSARLADVSLTPPSHGFVLRGMSARLKGNEDELSAAVHSGDAHLDLADAPGSSLADVMVECELKVSRAGEGWKISTGALRLRHAGTKLELRGALLGGGSRLEPVLALQGSLRDADVAQVQRILGEESGRVFGRLASSVTAGQIERADLELRQPLGSLPDNGPDASFSGSLMLRDAAVSAGGQWPELTGVRARLEWHDGRVVAHLDAGRAGPFEIAGASADWRASQDASAHLSARVSGQVEDAITWIRDHGGLGEDAPRLDSLALQGAALFDLDVQVPRSGPSQTRIVASLKGAQLAWLPGAAPVQDLTGALWLEGGRLHRSTLSGSWLGGPLTLQVDEHREQGLTVLAMQAHGTLEAQRLAALGTKGMEGRLQGTAQWSGEFAFLPAHDGQPARWRMHADSTLAGLISELPDPLAKDPGVALPLHIELTGTNAGAQLRVSLGERLRSVLALEPGKTAGWRVERGAVTFGTTEATLPVERVVLIEGHVPRLDLPSYLALWQQARQDPIAPHFRAQLQAAELLAAGHTYADVSLLGTRSDTEVQLQIESPGIAGVARWPVAGGPGGPAEVHLTRLNLQPSAAGSELGTIVAALGTSAQISVDDLTWGGREVGRVTAALAAEQDALAVHDIHISGNTHDGTGEVRCQGPLTLCRADFTLQSSDAAATLADLGFRPDLSATSATVSGNVQWRPRTGEPLEQTLSGRISMKLADGTTRDASADPGEAFALFCVPALVEAMGPGRDEGGPRELRFKSLQADFELRAGVASTSDLHFDGDAEILMRGRADLLAHDYDQQVWILRGADRLPAAVRRFGPTPQIAAAWLTLRDLFAVTADGRPRAMFRLQGPWDDPVLVADNQ